MTRSVKNLLDIARSQIGYKEKASNAYLDDKTANAGSNNYTKYSRDLYGAGYYQASKQGFAWCDVFVDWCFWQLCDKDADIAQKMIYQTGPYGAGCSNSAGYYKNAGRYYRSNPKPGDQIFFGSTFSHTGIVEEVTATTITTIEGNAVNDVRRVTYPINSSKINGFGRPNFEPDNQFDDVSNNAWYADEVLYCREKGLMDGVGDNKFEPERAVTRAELATVLSRLQPDLKKNTVAQFDDVSSTAWYADEVLYCRATGLMNGIGDNKFEPERAVTRSELATVLSRVCPNLKKNSVSQFIDVSKDVWYADEVLYCRATGLMDGVGDNKFEPERAVTRAELATVLSRVHKMM